MQYTVPQSVINLCPNTTSLLPLPTPVSHPFVSTGVTCRHQFPIRQNNIHPILPACDWEISEWSKPTNRIYGARINEQTEPSLIALLNNGCLFGNHFPISQRFYTSSARPVPLVLVSFLLFLYGGSVCLFDLMSLGTSWTLSDDAQLIASLLRRRVLLSLKHLLLWFMLSLSRETKGQMVLMLHLIQSQNFFQTFC